MRLRRVEVGEVIVPSPDAAVSDVQPTEFRDVVLAVTTPDGQVQRLPVEPLAEGGVEVWVTLETPGRWAWCWEVRGVPGTPYEVVVVAPREPKTRRGRRAAESRTRAEEELRRRVGPFLDPGEDIVLTLPEAEAATNSAPIAVVLSDDHIFFLDMVDPGERPPRPAIRCKRTEVKVREYRPPAAAQYGTKPPMIVVGLPPDAVELPPDAVELGQDPVVGFTVKKGDKGEHWQRAVNLVQALGGYEPNSRLHPGSRVHPKSWRHIHHLTARTIE